MQLKNVGEIHSLLKDSPLAVSRLWDRDVETIKPVEFTCFIRRMKERGYEDQAAMAVETALNEIFKAIIQGDVHSTALIRSFSEIKIPDSSKVEAKLDSLTLVRKKAFIFMLESGLSAQEVIKLKWQNVLNKKFTQTAKMIINSMPRHIKSELVFWEYNSKAAPLPLLGFIEQSQGIMEQDWSNYLMYDYQEEMRSFQNTVSALFKTSGG